jgi:hypothetical protein
MKASLSLRYAGAAVDDGLMDVYQASANMIAFSEFMVATVKAVYGERAEAKAEVAGFGKGSFVTDLVFNVGGPIASMFASFTTDELLGVIKGAFELWKHLKGEPPAAVAQSGQTVTVTNNSGQVIQVQTDSLNLVFSERGAEAVGHFVRDAIAREGIDAVEIRSGKEKIAAATQADAQYFVPVDREMPVSENTVIMALFLVAPVFQDGNKWRFSDGASSFAATIEDEDFIARVNDGERFGKDDVLTVEMRVTQVKANGKIEVRRVVQKVLEHREAARQRPLL